MLNGQLIISTPIYNINCDSYNTLNPLILHIVKTLSQNHSFLVEPINFTKDICC